LLSGEIDRKISDSRASATVPVVRARIETGPLDVEDQVRAADSPGAGAVVSFTGKVRDHDGGRTVRALEYSAHPGAQQVLDRVANEIAATHAGLRGITVSHRVGPLSIGEVALCAVVTADHRQEAFAACADLVEKVKHQLPVWKLQTFTGGEREWVGCA
jgi:molybdopterin synthase catalytic subunit